MKYRDGIDMSFRDSPAKLVLLDPKLKEDWESCLDIWEDASAEQRNECITFIATLCDDFIASLDDICDPVEQTNITAVFFANLKSHWIMKNTQAGYQAQTATVDIRLLCQAGLLSTTLGALESVIDSRERDAIHSFLADRQEYSSEADTPTATLAAMLTKENVILLSDRERLLMESGTDSVEAAIARWRETRDLLAQMNVHLVTVQGHLAAFIREFGENTSPEQVVERLRRLSDDLTRVQNEQELSRIVWERMGSEFGVTHPEQVIQMVRQLRDRINQLTGRVLATDAETELLRSELGVIRAEEIIAVVHTLRDRVATVLPELTQLQSDQDLLRQELGTSEAQTIITQIRAQRGHSAVLEQELVLSRADQELLVRELGTSDAGEIVKRIQSLNARGEAFGELSSLLGNMEQALTTLNS